MYSMVALATLFHWSSCSRTKNIRARCYGICAASHRSAGCRFLLIVDLDHCSAAGVSDHAAVLSAAALPRPRIASGQQRAERRLRLGSFA